jgi:signal transduction histidine kinase
MALSAVEALPREAAVRGQRPAQRMLGLIAIGLFLFAASVAAVVFTRYGTLTALWPTNAIAFVALMRAERSGPNLLAMLAVIFVALAAPLMLGGMDPIGSVLLALGNVAEVALAAWLTHRYVHRDGDVGNLVALVKLLLVTAVIPPVVAATLTTPVVVASLGGQPAQVWFEFWAADALGMLVIAPFGLALRWREVANLTPRRWAEAGVLMLAIIGAGLMIFGHSDVTNLLLLTPVLILAALRFGGVGAATACLTMAAIAVGCTVAGMGPIADLPNVNATEKVLWLQVYLAAVCLSTLPVAAVLRDRDHFAAEMKAQQKRALAASEGKSRLLANVSHEIKSPVAGIIGIGELWAAGKLGPVNATQEEMAEMLVRTARQVEALAYDLLDVAHAEAGSVTVKLQPVDLEGLVEDVRRSVMMKPEAAGIRWTVEGRGERLTAQADSVRMVQIVTNLVTNAVKYGGSGGVVGIKLSRIGERVRIEVADKGPGIPLAKQGELFEPFNRLGMEKSTVEGHGIGLALAKRLAELQGGAIGFASTPGEGSRFWVELPAAA